AGWPARERRRRLGERLETATEVDRVAAAEAGAHLADVDELPGRIVHPQQQRADPAPPPLRVGESTDDELLLLDTLRLEPAPAPPRLVGSVATLGDPPLERHAAGMAEERLAVSRHVVAVAQRRSRAPRVEQRPQRLLALLQRCAGEVVAVEMQE